MRIPPSRRAHNWWHQQQSFRRSHREGRNSAEVFAADPIMASVALGRLLHRSTLAHIRGGSYWLKENHQAKSQPFEG
jgi:hypothetical protein